MNLCTTCQSEMKTLFSSFFCPNDCDLVRNDSRTDNQEGLFLQADPYIYSIDVDNIILNDDGTMTIKPGAQKDFWKSQKSDPDALQWFVKSGSLKLKIHDNYPDVIYAINDGSDDLILEPTRT